MEVSGDGYRVWYDDSAATVFFEGTLRLNTSEYEPISKLLNRVLEEQQQRVTLHVRELRFLNSSGINLLYKFAISLRKRGDITLSVCARDEVGWQSKSLPNLKKFLPTTEIEVA